MNGWEVIRKEIPLNKFKIKWKQKDKTKQNYVVIDPTKEVEELYSGV